MKKEHEFRTGTIVRTETAVREEAHYRFVVLDCGQGDLLKCRIREPRLFAHLQAMIALAKNRKTLAEIRVRGVLSEINSFVEQHDVFEVIYAERVINGPQGKTTKYIDISSDPVAA